METRDRSVSIEVYLCCALAMASSTSDRPYVVRNSLIHGRGVFAARKISKGTPIIEYRGQRVSWDEALTRPDTDPDNPFHTFFFSLDDGRVIDAGVRGNAARWINHSCSPNCKTIEDEDGRVYIRARRGIDEGEELTYDYNLSIDGKLTKRELAHFECRCAKKKCRGTMLDGNGKKPKKKAKKKKKNKNKYKIKSND